MAHEQVSDSSGGNGSAAAGDRAFHIGVDIGGTFTDVVVSSVSGNLYRAKGLTAHGDYGRGIVDVLELVAERELNMPLEALLARTQSFVNGTTIVTNAIAELRGSRVGLIVTKGTRDTLRIARAPRTNDYNMQTQVPLPDLVPREAIVEVEERVDYSGRVVVALTRERAEAAVRHVVEQQGAEALAVCLLWSFQNPDHERLLGEVARELYPDMFVSLSSDVHPVHREYERMVTTVLNSFSGDAVANYVDGLARELSTRGLEVPFALMQSIGGRIPSENAKSRPISLINSGPVGGVIGAQSLGREYGIDQIITADMGGTSFDCALIDRGEVGLAHRAELNRFLTGLSLIDISAIGAGGGSIAWIDNRGLPRVGPRSAGSVPGPACYGRGGTEPTVTDVSVALGFIDPDYFLGGSMHVDRSLAEEAIARHVGEPVGWNVTEAAAAIWSIVVQNMSGAVRAVSIEKGHDPREFTMVQYGGAGALFSAAIARSIAIGRVIIPANASTFSANGLVHADSRRSYVRTVNWNVLRESPDHARRTYAELVEEARTDLHADGFADDAIEMTIEGDFKFLGQAFEVTMPVDVDALEPQAVYDRFVETYEAIYGEDTAWEGFDVMLLNCRVTGVGQTEKPTVRRYEVRSHDAQEARKGDRTVYMPDVGREEAIPVYSDQLLTPGAQLEGPAIVEVRDTTIYVPVGTGFSVDGYGNYVLEVS
jgi:N-methylhydantoinase A